MQRLLPPLLFLPLLVISVVLGLLVPVAGPLTCALRILGVPVAAAGLTLNVGGAGLFQRTGTNIKTFNDPGVLVTEGPFRFTRNPMYLGFTLMLSGAALLVGEWGTRPRARFRSRGGCGGFFPAASSRAAPARPDFQGWFMAIATRRPERGGAAAPYCAARVDPDRARRLFSIARFWTGRDSRARTGWTPPHRCPPALGTTTPPPH